MESSAMLAIFTQHVHVRLNWLRSGHDRWRHLAFAASPLMANGLRCQRLQRHMPLGPNTQLCGPKSQREWREGSGSWSRSGKRRKSRNRSRSGTRSRSRSWSCCCCWSRSLPLAFIKRKFMPLLKCQILQMSNAEADPGLARWVPPDNPRAPVPQLPACYCCCCCCCGNTVNAACLCPAQSPSPSPSLSPSQSQSQFKFQFRFSSVSAFAICHRHCHCHCHVPCVLGLLLCPSSVPPSCCVLRFWAHLPSSPSFPPLLSSVFMRCSFCN